MTPKRISELAALEQAGALNAQEQAEWRSALAGRDPEALREASAFANLAALLTVSQAAPRKPSPALKNRIMDAIAKKQAASVSAAAPAPLSKGFSFVPHDSPAPWVPLAVPGAFVKLLSMDQTRGYAVVLGKLEAGARYPAHRHIASEQVYVLSGDLHIGSERLEVGDFHHADADTCHDVNYSENGCVVLVVLSLADLQAQYAAT